MTWIKTLSELEAEGSLKESYDAYLEKNQMSQIPNILKAFSLSPEAYTCHYDYYAAILHARGPLRRYQREMIATRVSQINRCHY